MAMGRKEGRCSSQSSCDVLVLVLKLLWRNSLVFRTPIYKNLYLKLISSSVTCRALYSTMPINNQELMKVLSDLADQRNLKVSVTESFKGGLLTGAAAFCGGLVMGPPGLAIGGIIGSLYAAWFGSGKFKSVAHVILHDMTPSQQSQLAESCRKIIEDLRVEDVAVLLPLLLNTPSAQQAILQTIISYFANEMKLQIID